MTLIDGDRIVTAQLYDDEHEEFTEQKMSIIDYVNAYTDEGVTTADEVLEKIRAEIAQLPTTECTETHRIYIDAADFKENVLEILDKYKAGSEVHG
jgi:predicted double-glycine peptidase